MAVNYYFQSGVPEEFTANQRLIEDMIIQSIQITGFETYYIPRQMNGIDGILTESSLSSYEHALPLEMYLENVQGFDGDNGMLSKFGIEINDSCTFVVARRRWDAEVGRTGWSTSNQRPVEGDIVYLPMTKSFFEIKKVQAANPFYQLGKLFVYRLECELFQFASEDFNTGIEEIDMFSDMHSMADNNFFVLTEEGAELLQENGANVMQEYDIADVDGGAMNDIFNDVKEEVLDFSENNPFGEVLR